MPANLKYQDTMTRKRHAGRLEAILRTRFQRRSSLLMWRQQSMAPPAQSRNTLQSLQHGYPGTLTRCLSWHLSDFCVLQLPPKVLQ